MPRRDHLVPSMTVDRNGHAKTVYVNPGGGSPSLAALAFASPSVSGDSEADEWTNISDPESWALNDFTPDDAEDWQHAGFEDGDTAAEWRSSGLGFDDAAEWRKAEFDADDAAEWRKAGFDPEDAKKWWAADLDPSEAKAWVSAGVDEPSVAGEWAANGFDPEESKEWRAAKFDADDAEAWKEGASRASNPSVAALKELMDLGAESEDAAAWLNLLDEVHRMDGGKDETLSGLWATMDGEFPSNGYAYQHHFPYRQWGTLSQAGIDSSLVSEVQEVQEAIDGRWQDEHYEGFEDGDPEYESDLDSALELACDWFRGGEIMSYKVDAVRALVAMGATPSDCSAFLLDARFQRYSATDADNILWACKMASALDSPQLRDEAFRPLFEAAGTDGVRELAEKHGAKRFEAALHAGLRTPAQIRSYLEHTSVGGIAEGAL